MANARSSPGGWPTPRDSAMDTFENRIGSPETRQGLGSWETAVRGERVKSPANFRGQGYGIRLPNVFVA